ncbi:MAG: hypothetical protein ACREI5_01575 [Candidatus Methylomirabilales bacterium]
MTRQAEWGRAILRCAMALALFTGCALFDFEATPPGPGVPRISDLRIEPDVVERGGQATLRFDFTDLDGDIMDVYLGLRSEVKDFTLATGLRPAVISRGKYLGQTEGTAEETITISFERRFAPLASEERDYEGGVVEPERRQQEIGGIRVYEIFVVDRKGNVSNSLRARVTVR